jgi:hypothetical protein
VFVQARRFPLGNLGNLGIARLRAPNHTNTLRSVELYLETGHQTTFFETK